MGVNARKALIDAERLVVKVGSSSITGDGRWRIPLLVGAIAAAHRRGVEVVLVTSGAIANGMPLLHANEHPNDLATQQAAAAVGQTVLMYQYQQALAFHGITAGQVLLTSGDLDNQTTSSNARRAIDRMLHLGVLPIVNENDTVATAEIRFGDNDRLAALVARLIGADALVLLSDVKTLYTKPPTETGAEPIEIVSPGDDLSQWEFGATVVNSVGTGGAATKASAAVLAASSGIGTLVTSTDVVARALAGENVGTWFSPHER